jgi:hypothetical protein
LAYLEKSNSELARTTGYLLLRSQHPFLLTSVEVSIPEGQFLIAAKGQLSRAVHNKAAAREKGAWPTSKSR